MATRTGGCRTPIQGARPRSDHSRSPTLWVTVCAARWATSIAGDATGQGRGIRTLSQFLEHEAMIEYFPYIAFIAKFDHARALRLQTKEKTQSEPVESLPIALNANLFSESCRQLAKELEFAKKRYPLPPRNSSPPSASTPTESSHWESLFQPICYATLGHSDDIGIVLLDNLAAVTRLTALGHAMEDSDVAFCPNVERIRRPARLLQDLEESLKDHPRLAAKLRQQPHWPFVSLHELIGSRSENDAATPNWSNAAAFPAKLSASPLCVVADFKTNILSSLPHGVPLQRTLYATIVHAIQKLCLGLLTQVDDANIRPLITREDVEQFQCVLLESQGAEDLVLLMFGSNYALADMLVASLRNLTLADLAAVAPKTMSNLFRESRIHRQIIENSRRTAANPDRTSPAAERNSASELSVERPDDEASRILGNHVFMQSYSTLCFAHHLVTSENVVGVRGVCEASMSLDLSPGHEFEIETLVKEALEKVFQDARVRAGAMAADQIEKTSISSLPGRHDMVTRIAADMIVELATHDANPSSTQPAKTQTLIPTSAVFMFLRSFFNSLKDASDKRNPGRKYGSTRETGLLDSYTSLSIRIPRVDSHHNSALGPFLPGGRLPALVDWDGHGHGLDYFEQLREKLEQRFGVVRENYLRFRNVLRDTGCPPSTQYSLIYLFQEFLSCIGDPLRCDAVLDLFENFDFLHQLLGEPRDGENQEACADRADADQEDDSADASERLGRLKRQWQFDRMRLGGFLDAFQNAFTLRIQRSIPNHETRDSAFSLRSNFNKLILAMDVPLKCGLTMFRRAIAALEGCQDSDQFRQRFGAATAVRVQQHTDVKGRGLSDRLSTDLFKTKSSHATTTSYWLALNIDVFHLFRPEQIHVFLHEVAHLFQMTPMAVRGTLRHRLDESGDDNARARTDECLADLIPHLFIFGQETDLFIKYHGITFSELQGRVIQVDVLDTIDDQVYQFAALEAVFRGFLVADLIGSLPENVRCKSVMDWPRAHPVYGLDGVFDPARCVSRWLNHLRDYGDFYEGLDAFWRRSRQSDERTESLWRQAELLALGIDNDQFLATMGEIWTLGMDVMLEYWNALDDQVKGFKESWSKAEPKLRQDVKWCLQQGRPLNRRSWERMLNISPTNWTDRLDALLVVAQLAREYIRITYGSLDSKHAIHARPYDSLREGQRGSCNRYLFHPSHASLYSVDPDTRRERLKAQIACVKTLWDISSEFRAQQLLMMSK